MALAPEQLPLVIKGAAVGGEAPQGKHGVGIHEGVRRFMPLIEEFELLNEGGSELEQKWLRARTRTRRTQRAARCNCLGFLDSPSEPCLRQELCPCKVQGSPAAVAPQEQINYSAAKLTASSQ